MVIPEVVTVEEEVLDGIELTVTVTVCVSVTVTVVVWDGEIVEVEELEIELLLVRVGQCEGDVDAVGRQYTGAGLICAFSAKPAK